MLQKKKYLEHLNNWIELNRHCIGPSFDNFPFPKLIFVMHKYDYILNP
jgi:hypothetical protein